MIILISSLLYGWLLGVEWSNDGKCAVMFFSILETLFEFVAVVYVIGLLIDWKMRNKK